MQNKDILGRAIYDFYLKKSKTTFSIHYRNHEPDEMPIDVFFREGDDTPVIEQYALSLVKGTVLDVGAGAGVHSLELSKNGYAVTALDYSKECVKVMSDRGVKNVHNGNIFHWDNGEKYDTILLLMNGIGLARKLKDLVKTIDVLKLKLNPGGQILFDSSDLSYLYENVPKPTHYFGEIESKFEYNGLMGDWESWLYVDPYTMIDICEKAGIDIEIIVEDDTGLYLAKIVDSK